MINKNIVFYWTSTLFGAAGFIVQNVVISWVVYELTDSPLLTSITLGIWFLPMLILAPVGGLIADRFDRKYLATGSCVSSVIITLTFVGLYQSGIQSFALILIYKMVSGLTNAQATPARVAQVADIVRNENLIRTFAYNECLANVSILITAGLTGFLLLHMDISPILLISSMAHTLAALILIPIRLSNRQPGPLLTLTGIPAINEAIKYLQKNKSVLVLIMLGAILPLLVLPYITGILPVYASEVFNLDSFGYGILISSGGIGSVLGTIFVTFFRPMSDRTLFISICIFCLGILMGIFSVMSSFFGAVILLSMISTLQIVIWTTNTGTIQSIVPNSVRGRVTSVSHLVIGTFPIGSLIAGSFAEHLGPQYATRISVVIVLGISTLFLARHKGLNFHVFRQNGGEK